jgi:hypothetical protein
MQVLNPISLQAVVIPVNKYPESEEDFDKLSAQICNKLVADFRGDYPDADTGTFFVTRSTEDVAKSASINIPSTCDGVIVFFPDLNQDMIFYIAAVLKADSWVRTVDKHLLDEEQEIIVVWNGKLGVDVIGRNSPNVEYEEFPKALAKHLIPQSLVWDQATAN